MAFNVFAKSFASLFSCVFGLLTTQLTSDASDFVKASWKPCNIATTARSVRLWLCVLRAQGLAVRNMCSLHISTDSWVLSHAFGMERDYYAVPFKPRFISQSLCKCDRSLPLESIRKKPRILDAPFSFCNRPQGYFCSSWSWGISETSRKDICIACSKWNDKSAILSTAPIICQHEDVWPITTWYQILVIIERRH